MKEVSETVLTQALEEASLQRKLRSTINGSELLSRLSRGSILDLLCFTPMYFREILGMNIWTFLNLPVMRGREDEDDFALGEGLEIRLAAPSWMRLRRSQQLPLSLQTGPEAQAHVVEKYVFALFDALEHPGDCERDLLARKQEKELLRRPKWDLSAGSVLGPSPTEFASEDDWRRYKREVREFLQSNARVNELRSLCMTFRQPPAYSGYPWCAILFHPDHWNLLVDNKLINAVELSRIREFSWSALMNIPTNLLDTVE